MRIKTGLLGLGRTGQVVAQSLWKSEQFDLAFVVKNSVTEEDRHDFPVYPKEQLGELLDTLRPDMVIDFSTPDAVLQNIARLPDGTGYVIATSPFKEDQLVQLRAYKNLKIMHAPNISDGINTVIKLCDMLNNIYPQADVEIIEQHFKNKKDAPSDTAMVIADTFTTKKDVPIHSVRAGDIVGVHEVLLVTGNQKITVRHESFDKTVFAQGAKRAAIWLMDKAPGFYSVREVYQEI